MIFIKKKNFFNKEQKYFKPILQVCIFWYIFVYLLTFLIFFNTFIYLFVILAF